MLLTADQPQTFPHSEESERAVLAAILLDAQRQLPTTAGRLRAEDFYFDRHQRIYQSMIDLQSALDPEWVYLIAGSDGVRGFRIRDRKVSEIGLI